MNTSQTVAILRVSSEVQSNDRQELVITKWAVSNELKISTWVRTTISSKKTEAQRGLDLLSQLQAGDTVVVAELSRLGRSVSQLVRIVTDLVERGISFHSLKENIHFSGTLDISSKTMLTVFSLLAELERDLISSRTKEALAARKANGVTLGRPKGSRSSRLDSKIDEIKHLLSLGVSVTSISKIMGCKQPTLSHFIKSRKLV